MDDQQAWDMYFMSIAGWSFHPGNVSTMQEHLDDCRIMANEMLKIRTERWPP